MSYSRINTVNSGVGPTGRGLGGGRGGRGGGHLVDPKISHLMHTTALEPSQLIFFLHYFFLFSSLSIFKYLTT